MHIVVAPDSYKGSLSAVAVANAMERGIHGVFPKAQVTKVPIADGGEGTVEALVAATNGQIIPQYVIDPLGNPVEAYWGLLGDGITAVIEMAAASGLSLVPKEKRNPLYTTTYGTGQLIKAVLDRGIRRLIIGIGGSATNDGGVGMAQALGVRFLDIEGADLPYGGAALANLSDIDLSGIDPRLDELTIRVACDVDNPLCGPRGASVIFGPQKGAVPGMVDLLDKALAHYAEVAMKTVDRNVMNQPGAGAAGGLGAGLMLFTNAQLQVGIDIVLEAIDFPAKIMEADLVITGEGNTDDQTAFGKAPVGVAKIAKRYGVPTVCLSGGLGKGCEDVLKLGIDGLMSIVPRPMELEECMNTADELIEASTARLCRLIRIGKELI